MYFLLQQSQNVSDNSINPSHITLQILSRGHLLSIHPFYELIVQTSEQP